MIYPTSLRSSVLGAMFAAVLPVPCAQAQDDASEGTRQACLTLRGVDKYVPMDDRTILFFMRGRYNHVYRNDLPKVCRDLKRNRGISYQTTASRIPRLCAGDLITVSETGQACRLGEFQLISAEQAESLMRNPSEVRDQPEHNEDQIDSDCSNGVFLTRGTSICPREGAYIQQSPR
jgi:hypothetical protein